MPMNKTTFKSELQAYLTKTVNVTSINPETGAVTVTPTEIVPDADGLEALAKIIDHIKANAQVPSGITVSTTGTAAAQSGATTAPGTVT